MCNTSHSVKMNSSVHARNQRAYLNIELIRGRGELIPCQSCSSTKSVKPGPTQWKQAQIGMLCAFGQLSLMMARKLALAQTIVSLQRSLRIARLNIDARRSRARTVLVRVLQRRVETGEQSSVG